MERNQPKQASSALLNLNEPMSEAQLQERLSQAQARGESGMELALLESTLRSHFNLPAPDQPPAP